MRFNCFLLVLFLSAPAWAADSLPGEENIDSVRDGLIDAPEGAPPRAEGQGPFDRMVLRGGIMVEGSGAPPRGPVDIVIEGNRITEIKSVGYPGAPIDEEGRPDKGDFELDVAGMYILPGFVDAHAHIAYAGQGKAGPVPPADYVYKLWLAHGVTTVREIGSFNGLGWTLEQKEQSASNAITAPRILAYAGFPTSGKTISDAAAARAWVKAVKKRGADGIKFLGQDTDVMIAALDEARRQGLGTGMHHAQLAVTRMDVMDTSGWGLQSMEHWYGLPEALFTDRVIQDYPADYNYNNEQDRFGQAGRLWKQAAPRGSERWNEVIDTLIERDFTIDPTLTIYEASRDLMRAMRAEWHEDYTHPTLWNWYRASRKAHGSYWFYWTTEDEVEWKNNFQIWMSFLKDFHDRGGRLTVGSDSGFIYKLFGFGYIRELELLQEAGLHPLEVIRAATINGAELVGMGDQIGTIRAGKLADLVIVAENPLANFKVLYGTGAMKLDDETDEVIRVGGVRYTIKDGIVFDAKELLADVRAIVAEAREKGE